jgi:hypothetical protein
LIGFQEQTLGLCALDKGFRNAGQRLFSAIPGILFGLPGIAAKHVLGLKAPQRPARRTNPPKRAEVWIGENVNVPHAWRPYALS